MQHHSEKTTLFIALTPMFKMLLNYMTTHDYVCLYQEKFDKYCQINYNEMLLKFKNRKILKVDSYYKISFTKRKTKKEIQHIKDMVERDDIESGFKNRMLELYGSYEPKPHISDIRRYEYSQSSQPDDLPEGW